MHPIYLDSLVVKSYETQFLCRKFQTKVGDVKGIGGVRTLLTVVAGDLGVGAVAAVAAMGVDTHAVYAWVGSKTLVEI